MQTLRVMICLAGLTGLGLADSITLRDGRVVNGSYLGGDARSVRFAAGNRVEISSIAFGDVAPPNELQPPPASARREDRREDRREEPRGGQELRSGSTLTVRMIDSVDSQRDQVGKMFRASLDEPVVDSNGNTIIPRGADANVKLIDDKESGKLAGRTVLTLSLASIMVNGRMVDVNTMNVTEQSGSRTARSGKVIGGAAAAGAIIGAIAGGGKGAAIGAGAGAGAGTVAEVATKGQRVHIPSETRLTFTLQDPVRW
jgi:hypothetical protein